jgi:parallel beta-helix repeat protein
VVAQIRSNNMTANQRHAAANVGVNSPTDQVESPNTIQNNGNGIVLTGMVQANVIGNTIRNNSNNGISLNRGAQANIDKNTINGNFEGIYAIEGAGVNLGGPNEDVGILPLFVFPNSTTVKNADFGIVLGVGAYAAGSLGTLNGNFGQVGYIDPDYNITDLTP